MQKQNKLILKGFHWDKKYLKANSPENSKITFLSLETKPICNAKCLYCFAGPEIGKIPKNCLTLEEYKDILIQAKKLGVKTVSFPGVGEPTLDKNLKPLVQFINKLELISVIYTNCLIKKELINFFYKNNVSLIIKIDSLNERHFKKLVGLPFQTYKRRLNYIVNLFEKSVEKKKGCALVRLAANSVVTDFNKDEIKKIADFCQSHHIKYFVASISKVGRAEKNWERLTGGQIENLDKITKQYDTWVSSATLDNRCGLFSHGITIDVNGDLIGCSTARWIRLGNVRNLSLKELIRIYNNQKVFCNKKNYCLAREPSLNKNADQICLKKLFQPKKILKEKLKQSKKIPK